MNKKSIKKYKIKNKTLKSKRGGGAISELEMNKCNDFCNNSYLENVALQEHFKLFETT